MKSSRKRLLRLLELIEVTAPEEIDCGEFLDRMAGFVERVREEDAAPPGYEAVVHHLRVCAECRDECEALLRALREEDSK